MTPAHTPVDAPTAAASASSSALLTTAPASAPEDTLADTAILHSQSSTPTAATLAAGVTTEAQDVLMMEDGVTPVGTTVSQSPAIGVTSDASCDALFCHCAS